MMISFHSLKLAQTTVEEYSHVPAIGEVVEGLRRWPGKRFVVSAADPAIRPSPLVMLREVKDAELLTTT